MKLRPTLLSFILLLALSSVSAQEQNQIDGLKAQLDVAQTEEEITSIIGNLLEEYYQIGDMRSAEHYVDYGIEISKSWSSQIPQGRFLYTKSRLYDFRGNLDSAMKVIDRVIQIYESEKYTKGYVDAYNVKGMYLQSLSNYVEADKFFDKAIQVNIMVGDSLSLAHIYNNKAIVQDDIGNDEKAIEYYYAAIKVFQHLGDQVGIARAKGNIAQLKAELGDYNSAVELLLSTLNNTRQDLISLTHRHNALANNYYELDSISPCRKHAMLSIFYADSTSYREQLATSYSLLGRSFESTNSDSMNYYFALAEAAVDSSDLQSYYQLQLSKLRGYIASGDWRTARDFYDELQSTPSIEKMPQPYANMLSLGSVVFEELGNFKQSLMLQRESTTIQESIDEELAKKQIAYLKAQFDFVEQDRVIAQKEKELSETRAEKQFYLIVALLIAVVAILIGALLLIKRKDEKIVIQEKELIIAELKIALAKNKELIQEFERIQAGESEKTLEEFGETKVTFSLRDRSKKAIKLSDIFLFEVKGRITTLRTVDNKPYEVVGSSKVVFEKYLPKNLFAQTTKSTFVNRLKIDCLKGDYVYFTDDVTNSGRKIDVSPVYKKELERML